MKGEKVKHVKKCNYSNCLYIHSYDEVLIVQVISFVDTRFVVCAVTQIVSSFSSIR